MRATLFLSIVCSLTSWVVEAEAATPAPIMLQTPHLHFEPTARGFIAKARAYSVRTTSKAADFSPTEGQSGWSLRFIGASKVQGEGIEPTGGVSNYFLGRDPTRWRTGVRHFRRIRYANIWPGIDLVYRGDGRNLEYDLIVQPGGDPSLIQLALEGAKQSKETPAGDLRVETATGAFVMHKPKVYQQQGDTTVEIAANYRLHGARLRFEVAA